MTDFGAELLGACALVTNFIGYRQNEINRYRMISGVGLVFLSAHFFMLDAMAAGIACLLSSVRNIIAIKTQHIAVVIVFVMLHLLFLAYEWFILHHNAWIFVAYTSSIIFTVGTVMLSNTTRIRQWFIVAESLGLVYALSVGSVFGSIFNISNLISIFIKLAADKPESQRDECNS
ncbi:YgjV family protein [Aestuariibacter sp. AA17]|uniref:YgjV family protein n=1 Tax=Fluctibacter corallii TaxID=2984329 RepID=A0ABT3A7M3_9ALTE|nr:YgjV family protein [Aestuariibacter sp. AA17]MCV2884678.1 YgjV family protein [Aestuariibacter sp. AA17]